MKKLFLLATAVLLVTGVSFGNTDKGKKKKCAKGTKCCHHGAKCCKDKTKTVKL